MASTEAEINILDLAADAQGNGPPHALGRRVPAMIAQLLQAAGIRARHASATVSLESSDHGECMAWAVPAGVLDDGKAIELSHRMGPAQLLAFGELGPLKPQGMTLTLRVLRRQDAKETLRLELDFFEEEVADIALRFARALAKLLDNEDALKHIDPRSVLGSQSSKALLKLHEGLDGLAAAQGGVEGSDIDHAIELLLAALDTDRSCSLARDHAMAALAENAGDALGLERALELASRLAELSNTQEQAPRTTLLLARLHRRRGSPERAREVLVNGLRRSPGAEHLVTELTQILTDQGDHDEAIRLCQTSLKQTEIDRSARANLYETLGLALARKEQLEEARDQLDHALQLDPDRASACANLARCHHLLGDHDRARQSYERSLELDPDSWQVARNSAELLVEQGDLKHAEELLRLWSTRQPKDPMPILALGELLAAQPNRDQEARDLLMGATERCTADSRLHALLGGLLTQANQLAEAEIHYREALQLAPDEPALMSNLAMVLSHAGQLPEAKQLARSAVLLDPHDPVSQQVLEHIQSKN